MIRVGIIAAMTTDGVIGVDGGIPWYFKDDLKRFKQLTMFSTVIFGAKTFESLPGRLPSRTLVVVSRTTHRDWDMSRWPDAVYGSIGAAIHFGRVHTKTDTVWIGGGGEIYRAALESGRVDFIDLTIVPTVLKLTPESKVTRFPVDLLVGWSLVEEVANSNDPQLLHRRYLREGPS